MVLGGRVEKRRHTTPLSSQAHKLDHLHRVCIMNSLSIQQVFFSFFYLSNIHASKLNPFSIGFKQQVNSLQMMCCDLPRDLLLIIIIWGTFKIIIASQDGENQLRNRMLPPWKIIRIQK